MQQLIQDLLTAYKYGLKTLYYHNTRDQAGTSSGATQKTANPTTVIVEEDEGCEGGACKI
jgi:ribonucleoside-diphosphate reductase alpha chain